MNNIKNRKRDHIDICINKDVQFNLFDSGFSNFFFEHQALPEIDYDEINLETYILNRKFSAPIFVSSMTGGIEQGAKINKNLAIACQNLNIPMGLGSQRIMLENKESKKSFLLRDLAPDIFLFGNIGAVQLNYGVSNKDIKFILEEIDANALFLHLNPLQEVIQEEGNKNFKGLKNKIIKLSEELEYPIILKETGCGISKNIVEDFNKTNIAGIDISGGGGTSWAFIESLRAKNIHLAKIGENFRNWGLPTSYLLANAKKVIDKNKLLFASGGIRTGIDVAKAISLGADMVGIAQPLLESALISHIEVENKLRQIIEELKISMFCTGIKNILELKNTDKLIKKTNLL